MNPVVTLILSISPDAPPPADTVTPGPLGFLAIFLVAVATILLGLDMVRRIRRTTYREEIRTRLEGELADREAAAADPSEGPGDSEAGHDRRPE